MLDLLHLIIPLKNLCNHLQYHTVRYYTLHPRLHQLNSHLNPHLQGATMIGFNLCTTTPIIGEVEMRRLEGLDHVTHEDGFQDSLGCWLGEWDKNVHRAGSSRGGTVWLFCSYTLSPSSLQFGLRFWAAKKIWNEAEVCNRTSTSDLKRSIFSPLISHTSSGHKTLHFPATLPPLDRINSNYMPNKVWVAVSKPKTTWWFCDRAISPCSWLRRRGGGLKCGNISDHVLIYIVMKSRPR